MSIQVKKDIKRKYKLGNEFSLKDIPNFKSGSLLDRVRGDIADQNGLDLLESLVHENSGIFQMPFSILDTILHAQRESTKVLARKFNLNPQDEEAFDKLWHFVREAREYNDKEKDNIQADIRNAYQYIARIVSDIHIDKRTFKRTISRQDANFVVFSDHHMTAFSSKPNYFQMYNYQLYLDVLKYYSQSSQNFCLVENGDVEECLIYEPDLADATLRKSQAPKAVGIDEINYPVKLSDEKWKEFLDTRYRQREKNLNQIIAAFPEYYKLIREDFKGKYVRITGNHDTYLDDEYEKGLKDRIQNEIGTDVQDVLKITRAGKITYAVLHGHQFDSVCLQHGEVPYAKSLGEIYSECLSWAYQGPDRVWRLTDTKKWYIGNTYRNVLASSEPRPYSQPTRKLLNLDLKEVLEDVKQSSKGLLENLLGHEIAWEYFENANAYEALMLEIWNGDETYKMRHMNEIDLCERYASEFVNLKNPPDFNTPLPAIILGHTHEPRKNAVIPDSEKSPPYYYLNTGSAGRYENLIWCIEIIGNEDKICSWSRVNGQLRKITWKSYGNQLIHDTVQSITI